MNILLNIAWKNIWRNRLRSLIIMSATTLGIFAGLLIVSFSKGMTKQRIANALNTEISHVQIHRPHFMVQDDITLLIHSADSVLNVLRKNELIAGYSPRILLNSIISSAETGTNVKVKGIDPEKEKMVTDLYQQMIEGSYFAKEKLNPVLLGQKLAEKLKVKLNSKIVLQIQDLGGNISPAAFRVSGIYKTQNTPYDEVNVFVLNKDLRILTGIDTTSVHEIAIYLKDYQFSKQMQSELRSQFPGLEIDTWKELDVLLSYMSDTMDQYLYFIMVVVLLALIFGIVNTMMMAILERVKELGMLMAIGMSRGRIVRMILYETVLLTLTGAFFGIAIGMTVINYYGHHGIDLSFWGKGMSQYGFASTVYTSIQLSYIMEVVLLVIMTGFMAAVFPVWKAIRMKPVEALKTDN
ncbi:MAG: FtsX-like permease family protein [Prolixibacteraceae bacterium]